MNEDSLSKGIILRSIDADKQDLLILDQEARLNYGIFYMHELLGGPVFHHFTKQAVFTINS